MENKKIEKYVSLMQFMGIALGPNYELVLHVIGNESAHIEAIVNNHISGRTINSPLTGFALKLIKEKVYLQCDYVTNYKAISRKGHSIVGSTFFIKDEDNNLEGLLCVNTDYTEYEELSKKILQLANTNLLQRNFTEDKSQFIRSDEKYHTGNLGDVVEILSNDIDDIIAESIDPEILKKSTLLNQKGKIQFVETLESKGVFQLKGAVSHVAKVLDISEPSIYRYLKIINEQKEKRY